jgi:polynucleotide 5'-triphosphatase
LIDVVLVPESIDLRFESNMSKASPFPSRSHLTPTARPLSIQNTHKHYNDLLNQLKISSSQPGHPSSPLEYAHRYLIDSFYPSDAHDKVRLTRDEKTGEVVECVRKIRLKDLNVYSPKRAADWRISVNLEVPGESLHFLYVGIGIVFMETIIELMLVMHGFQYRNLWARQATREEKIA